MVGLAAGCKYNVGIVAVGVPVAHLIRHGRRGWLDPRLYLAGVTAAVVFCASTPFLIFDFETFRRGFSFELQHYRTGHAGSDGNSLPFNCAALWRSESWRLCALPFLVLLRDRRLLRATAPLAAFVAAYFVLLSSVTVHFDRNLVPMLPPLLVLCALGLMAALGFVPNGRARMGLCGAVALLLCVQPIGSIAELIDVRRTNFHAEAEQWVASHLRAKSRVAEEAYGPWIDPRRFRVRPLDDYGGATRPEALLEHFDYVVLSGGEFARYYAEPQRYAREIAKYDATRSYDRIAS
jgi:hypothetical protein